MEPGEWILFDEKKMESYQAKIKKKWCWKWCMWTVIRLDHNFHANTHPPIHTHTQINDNFDNAKNIDETNRKKTYLKCIYNVLQDISLYQDMDRQILNLMPVLSIDSDLRIYRKRKLKNKIQKKSINQIKPKKKILHTLNNYIKIGNN